MQASSSPNVSIITIVAPRHSLPGGHFQSAVGSHSSEWPIGHACRKKPAWHFPAAKIYDLRLRPDKVWPYLIKIYTQFSVVAPRVFWCTVGFIRQINFRLTSVKNRVKMFGDLPHRKKTTTLKNTLQSWTSWGQESSVTKKVKQLIKSQWNKQIRVWSRRCKVCQANKIRQSPRCEWWENENLSDMSVEILCGG